MTGCLELEEEWFARLLLVLRRVSAFVEDEEADEEDAVR